MWVSIQMIYVGFNKESPLPRLLLSKFVYTGYKLTRCQQTVNTNSSESLWSHRCISAFTAYIYSTISIFGRCSVKTQRHITNILLHWLYWCYYYHHYDYYGLWDVTVRLIGKSSMFPIILSNEISAEMSDFTLRILSFFSLFESPVNWRFQSTLCIPAGL